MSETELRQQIAELAGEITGMALNTDLQDWLNDRYPATSERYRRLQDCCRRGIDAGWLCQHEAGGIHYGRIFKPAEDLQGFSVDVVAMDDVVGPHHRHPGGEIDLVMPQDASARFDGFPAGWVVYPPGSAHRPTVSGGRAIILYLLPEGSIEFTR